MTGMTMTALGLTAGARPIDDAWERIRRYCGAPDHDGRSETWAFQFYDAVDSDPAALAPVDLLVASALHPGITRTHLEHYVGGQQAMADWLATLPTDLRLDDADESLLDELATLSLRWRGLGLSLASKVLHRKRPELLPLIDRHVLDRYRLLLPGKRADRPEVLRALLEALGADLRRNAEPLAQICNHIRDAGLPRLTPLRALDIAVWMEGR